MGSQHMTVCPFADTPILGGTNGIPVNSQPASGMSNTGSAEKTPTEVVPGTETAPADLASQEGPDGMPNDYVGREIKNPDDLTMKHAGVLQSSLQSTCFIAQSCAYGTMPLVCLTIIATFAAIQLLLCHDPCLLHVCCPVVSLIVSLLCFLQLNASSPPYAVNAVPYFGSQPVNHSNP